jgi:predicted Zn finger-like uncharacterized protein
MNVHCPSCQTVFRVDPDRVPEQGIRARCSRCDATFAVSRTATPELAGVAAAPASRYGAGAAPAAAPPSPQSREPAARPEAQPGPGRLPGHGAAAPLPAPPPPAPGAVRADPPPAARPGAPPAERARPQQTPVFGSRDPQARAQRIARALVSDIVAYHPARRDACLQAGTLRTEFREEIMKSWEEYVAQVGLDMAKSTPYFRLALNDILAKGGQVF